MSELYTDRVFALAANMPRVGRLATPTGSATRTAKLCGSRITVDVAVENACIVDYAHEVEACLLGQTAAAIVAAHIAGRQVGDMLELGQRMRAMLKAGGAPPDGDWADLAILEAVREYPARHGSTLLVFEALDAALAGAPFDKPDLSAVKNRINRSNYTPIQQVRGKMSGSRSRH